MIVFANRPCARTVCGFLFARLAPTFRKMPSRGLRNYNDLGILEGVLTGNRNGGSNPPLSAMILTPLTLQCRGLCLAHVESPESEISVKQFNKLESDGYSNVIVAVSG